MTTSALVFPGLGIHKESLISIYQQHPHVQNVYRRAEQILDMPQGYLGTQLLNQETRQRIDISHLVIFISNHAIYQMAVSAAQESGSAFGFTATAGHSLGQYNSLVASGMLSYEQALGIVFKGAQLMQRAFSDSTFSLVAVLGNGFNLESLLRDFNLYTVAFNSPHNRVIGGRSSDIAGLKEKITKGLKIVDFGVSLPAHTPYMTPIANELYDDVNRLQFTVTSGRLVANTSASFIDNVTDLTTETNQHLDHPVMWEQTIRKMYDSNIRRFIVIDPDNRNLLGKLISKIVPSAEIVGVKPLSKLENLAEYPTP